MTYLAVLRVVDVFTSNCDSQRLRVPDFVLKWHEMRSSYGIFVTTAQNSVWNFGRPSVVNPVWMYSWTCFVAWN